MMAASTRSNPKIAAAASRSTTSGVGPEAARQAPLPRPYTSPTAEIGVSLAAPLHRLRPAGTGAAGDDAEIGARLFQRLRIHVRLSGVLFEVADPLRATRLRASAGMFCCDATAPLT